MQLSVIRLKEAEGSIECFWAEVQGYLLFEQTSRTCSLSDNALPADFSGRGPSWTWSLTEIGLIIDLSEFRNDVSAWGSGGGADLFSEHRDISWANVNKKAKKNRMNINQ